MILSLELNQVIESSHHALSPSSPRTGPRASSNGPGGGPELDAHLGDCSASFTSHHCSIHSQPSLVLKKKIGKKAGEIAQWLKGLAVLAEDPNSVPSIHTEQLTAAYNSSPGVSGISGLHSQIYFIGIYSHTDT